MSSTKLSRLNIPALVGELTSSKLNGRKQSEFDHLSQIRKIAELGGIRTLEPFLPLCLSLRGKPYTLANHFPFSPVFKTNMPTTLVLKTGRQVSKTGRPYSNSVYDQFGYRKQLGSIQVGDYVLSVDESTFTACTQRVIALHDAPAKECLRITTRRGVVLEFATTHPFRRLQGWTVAGNLRIGDRIAHIAVGGQFGTTVEDEARVRLTAYMLGDGCCGMSKTWSFTSSYGTAAIQEFAALASTLQENDVQIKRRSTRGVDCRLARSNRLIQWLIADGTAGKYSHEKRIPQWVFSLCREQAITFIERLWSTDGMIKQDVTKPQLSYTSTSRDLAFDVKALLLKFGIPCSIKARKAGYRAADGTWVRCRDAYVLRIETRAGWQCFLDTFTVPDKPGFTLRDVVSNNNRDTVPIEVGDIIADIAGECRGTAKAALFQVGLRKKPKYALSYKKLSQYVAFFQEHCPNHPQLPALVLLQDGDLEWDEVIAIDTLGVQPCCDIEVENTHNYIVDGIVSHNSTSLASHGVLLSNCIPDLRTLHITPRYEQIRRFSNNYVRPFIERSPIKSMWTGTTTENSVLQRSFKNYSVMLFSFALLDADRIRGVSCDKLSIDESVCGETTYVNSNRGCLKIKNVKPGDIVDSFYPDGTFTRKTVLANSYHGYRQCWRVRFASGAELTMTAESGIASNQGWLHASEIIKRMYDAHQRAGMHDSGNDARGRVDAVHKSNQRFVPRTARVVPASVQPGQRPNVISVRKQTTRDAEERRLREMVECLQHSQPSTIHTFRRVVLQPPTPNETVQNYQSSSSHQGSDTKLAGLDRSGRFSADDRVVVHGRRDQTRDCHITVDHMEHAGLHRSRGAVVSSVADETRVRVDLPGDLQQKAAGVLLRREDAGRTYAQTPAATHAVHRAFDVIQDIHLSNRSADVCLLQPGVRPAKNTIQRSAEATKTPVLPTTGVFESQTSGTLQQAHGETWSARTAEPASTESLLQESRSNEEIQSRNDAYLSPEQSCSRESRETQSCCESASITTADGVAMSTLWFDQTAGQNAQQYKILSSVSGDCHQRNQAAARGYQTDWDADQGVSGVSANVPVDEQRTEVVFSGVQDDHGESSTQTEIPTATEGWVWDQIVAVEDAGFRHVWDLHIEDTAVFCPNGIAGTNCQDMDPDHFPIMKECMSHSDYGITQYAGTPKSLDNPLEGLWQSSSQAEWTIPCYSCGKWNIPSMEFHVQKMIGPVHEGISENCPGTICYNCRRPVFPRQGHWIHRYKDRRHTIAGYHVPQIIMPLHYARPDKWGALCGKRDGLGNTSASVFCNEVLGESVDAGQRLISETELRAAATLPWKNNPDNPSPEMMRRLGHYNMRVLAVDWGGGGEAGVSFTVLTLLGLSPSGEIHVLWGKRLVISQEHLREAAEIRHWMHKFSCHMLVHDYTGAGIVRETVLVQAGLPLESIMPVQYVRAAASNLIRYVPASVLHNRAHYRLDKTRSLLYTFQAIKTRLIKTFEYDYISSERTGLLSDFLALVEEKKESRLSGDIYTITRNPLLTDDVAQAINIGCAGIWHATDSWPDFAAAAAIGKISISQEMDAGSANYGWETGGPSGFFSRG